MVPTTQEAEFADSLLPGKVILVGEVLLYDITMFSDSPAKAGLSTICFS